MESDDDSKLKTKESARNHLETVSDNDGGPKLEDGNNHLILSEKSVINSILIMTEELNCDKYRPEDDCSSTESPEIISSNELEDSKASLEFSMENTSPDSPDAPTPCLKPGM